jgi:adenylate kinase family enzyme
VTTRVVELAGPAGAGKTTLATAIRAMDSRTTVGVDAGRWRLAAALASAAPALIASRACATGRFWTRGELRNVLYLRAWRRLVSDRSGDGLLLLDHGPVFRLAALAAYGPPMVQTRPFRRWWTRTAEQWAGLLDAVAWLDAPDEVLLRRIDGRDRDHRVRGAGPDQAQAFLSRYRTSYRTLLDLLERAGTRVVSVDTSAATPEELALVVRQALDGAVPGRPR